MNETEFSYYFSIVTQLFSYREPKEDVCLDMIDSDIDLIRKYMRNPSILFYTHFNNKNNNTDFSLLFDQKIFVTLMLNIRNKLNYYIEG